MVRSLKTYSGKRDFKKTLEPSGTDGRPIVNSEHRRFVIHKHAARRLHYDLRLEVDGVLKSWAVTRGPSLDPQEKRLVVEVEDHPLEYGDFEGTIPKGQYGGGSVMIWDRGFWAPETEAPPAKSLADGELKLMLGGSKVRGSWVLVRLKRKPADKHDNWLLIKHRDQWATPGVDRILERDRSVASGRTMFQIAGGKGAAARPFITAAGATKSDAVWVAGNASAFKAPVDALVPKLSNPDRVLWPDADGAGITKFELAEYLVSVAPWMIGHLQGRPCSLLRAPEGIFGETFFQRHAMPGQSANIHTVTVDTKHQPYLQIDNAQSLVSQAQISVIEFHPWNCAPNQPLVPGRLVFDLDPGPEVGFDMVIHAARELRERLMTVGLIGFCKTTGGKGLHVVVPLTQDNAIGWPQAKLFTRTLCAQMAHDSPDRFLTQMSKKLRAGKIYLDYLRNDFTATAVAPLSPRARPGAYVSMPLNWAQVRRGLDAKRFTLQNAPGLCSKSRPWADYAKSARSLDAAIRKLVGGGR